MHPETVWSCTWNLAVTPGLTSEMTYFLWRMIHNILPTNDRLCKLNMPGSPSLCNLCDSSSLDSIEHALFQCNSSTTSATFLLSTVRNVLPDVQPQHVLLLDFDLSSSDQLPIMFVISSVLSQIWNSRKSGKTSNLHTVRSNLEAGIQILRKSRHYTAANRAIELLC